MDKDKLQEKVDGIEVISKIMARSYKKMIEEGLDTAEAVALSQSLVEVIIGQNNG